jgi:hypothetical protein
MSTRPKFREQLRRLLKEHHKVVETAIQEKSAERLLKLSSVYLDLAEAFVKAAERIRKAATRPRRTRGARRPSA